jgi:hypothetical protein
MEVKTLGEFSFKYSCGLVTLSLNEVACLKPEGALKVGALLTVNSVNPGVDIVFE